MCLKVNNANLFVFMMTSVVECTQVCFGVANLIIRCPFNRMFYKTHLVFDLRVQRVETLEQAGTFMSKFVVDADFDLGYLFWCV